MSVNIAMSSGVLFEKDQSPGPALPFVKALKAVNDILKKEFPGNDELFKVTVFTDKSTSVEKPLKEHGLEELILDDCKGDLVGYLKEHNIHLYLSESKDDVLQVLQTAERAAAVINNPQTRTEVSENQLRLVFDGDAVLFSDESEQVFKREGLQGFLDHEKNKMDQMMKPGPFKEFLEALVRLKTKLQGIKKDCPIRTYLVTSRGGDHCGYRVLNTLCSWNVAIDEAVFLGGSPKGPTLEKIRPHIFFDDQECHIKAALKVGIVAGFIPYN